MPKVYRSLDRETDLVGYEDGTISESGRDFPKFTLPVEEAIRRCLFMIDCYPMIRAAFITKYPDQADDVELEPEEKDYIDYTVALEVVARVYGLSQKQVVVALEAAALNRAVAQDKLEDEKVAAPGEVAARPQGEMFTKLPPIRDIQLPPKR